MKIPDLSAVLPLMLTGFNARRTLDGSLCAAVLGIIAALPVHAERIHWKLRSAWRFDDERWSVEGVQVRGKYAFVSHSASWTGTNVSAGFTVFSIARPTRPQPLASYFTTNWITGFRVTGPRAYLAESTPDFETDPNEQDVLRIIDLTNPQALHVIGSVSVSNRINHFDAAGDYLFLAERSGDSATNESGLLRIVDISNPAESKDVGQFATNGVFYDVRVAGDYAYIAGGSVDLLVLDVGDVTNPVSIASYNTNIINTHTGEGGGPATRVEIRKHVAYLAGGDGLVIVDVKTPGEPISLGGGGHMIANMRVSGRYAFIDDVQCGGLTGCFSRWLTFDISNPRRPRLVSGHTNGDRDLQQLGISDFAARGGWVYGAAGTNGLLVFERRFR